MKSDTLFEAIVSQHYKPLYRFAMSLTRSEADAWDLAQDTFNIWAEKGHQLRDLSKVKTWLFTTLHRVYLQRLRRQVRFSHFNLDDVHEELPSVAPADINQLDSSQVLSALARIDQVFQSAVALFYLEDYSYKEIALILEVPLGTVKSRILRGLLQLRKVLSDEQSAPTPWEIESSGTKAPVAWRNYPATCES